MEQEAWATARLETGQADWVYETLDILGHQSGMQADKGHTGLCDERAYGKQAEW
jgi:hypothetical protein